MIVCFGITACNGKQDQGNQGTTTQTATAQATTNAYGFDPNHPEGWVAEGDKWYKEKGTTDSDYDIGEFSIGMSLKNATKYFPSKSLSETKKNDGDYITKTLTFDSLVLTFMQVDSGSPFDLYSVEVIGKGYTTTRGLCIGDSAEKLYELYGVPAGVANNVWTFMDKEGFYSRFSVTVVKGIVKTILVNNVM